MLETLFKRTDQNLAHWIWISKSAKRVGSTCWVFTRLYPHHQEISQYPKKNVAQRNPAETCNQAEDASHVLRVLYVSEREFCHPRQVLAETHTVVSACLTKQPIHPARSKNNQEYHSNKLVFIDKGTKFLTFNLLDPRHINVIQFLVSFYSI